jgi:hypothetical protein
MLDMETTMKMKTTLFMSTMTAGLFAASVTFAQNFVMMPQTQGEAAALQSSEHAAPYDRFTRSDLDYHGRMIVRRHNTRSPAAGNGEPAPGQESD